MQEQIICADDDELFYAVPIRVDPSNDDGIVLEPTTHVHGNVFRTQVARGKARASKRKLLILTKNY